MTDLLDVSRQIQEEMCLRCLLYANQCPASPHCIDRVLVFLKDKGFLARNPRVPDSPTRDEVIQNRLVEECLE